MKRVPFEDRGTGVWIAFFICLKAIACIGIVVATVFVFKGSAIQFGRTQFVIAILLLCSILARLPTYTKQALIEENKIFFEDDYFTSCSRLEKRVWEYFSSYQRNQMWFFIIFSLSTLIAMFAAYCSFKSEAISLVALIVPILHMVLIILRLWTISMYELDPLPHKSDLFDW